MTPEFIKMLIITLLPVLLLVLKGTKGNGDKLVIKWRSCNVDEASSYDACFRIKFRNGIEDTIVLRKYMGFESVLMGTLKNEPSVIVAVSTEAKGEWQGKPFQASFASKFAPECRAFNVAADGSATCAQNDELDRSMENVNFTDYVNIPMEEVRKQRDSAFLNSEETRELNLEGYKVMMIAFYDDNMVARFGSKEEAHERITAAVGHANALYQQPSSLGTKIEIQMLEMKHIPGTTWKATATDLGRVSSSYSTNEEDANAYFFFGYDNNSYGTVGIAYLGSTCASKQYRTGIVEYFRGDVKTGSVLAHELGHNLGMEHDFVDSPGNTRRASDGSSCTDIDGIMDYNQVQSVWTKCSREDLTKYVDSVQPFCLESLMPSSSSTSTTTSTTTTTTRMSCTDVYPSSCVRVKNVAGCLGQWWNSRLCSKTCGLC